MVLSSRSALPWSMKRTVLTQEVLRVLLNCSPDLPWQHVVEHVNNMVRRMQYSGYDQKFRYSVVMSALSAYKKIRTNDLHGERPMYRPKEFRKLERRREKENKKRTWHKKGGDESVVFVPATPGSVLKRRLDRDIANSGVKIKLVERAGESVKRILQRSDPFKERECNRLDCFVCSTGGKGPCNAFGVTYEIGCRECNQKYVGETSRSAYTRGKEHLRDFTNNNTQSVLKRHCKEEHHGLDTDFTMNVTGVYGKDAMMRQVSESIRIRKEGVINTKNEWNNFSLPRAVVE